MFSKKKIVTLVSMLAFVIIGVAAVRIPLRKERNLKVLPKDISDAKLDSIMKTYTMALGVDCKFCHQPTNGFVIKPDYAADVNPMKENARDMMRMVIDINSKYFYYDSLQRPEYLHTITCKTCHQGQPLPPDYH
jgi:Photosynthetic reaction centre cytochrome C subunit